MFNINFVNILSDEKVQGVAHNLYRRNFLNQTWMEQINISMCAGPPTMMDAALKQVSNLKVAEDYIVTETF